MKQNAYTYKTNYKKTCSSLVSLEGGPSLFENKLGRKLRQLKNSTSNRTHETCIITLIS